MLRKIDFSFGGWQIKPLQPRSIFYATTVLNRQNAIFAIRLNLFIFVYSPATMLNLLGIIFLKFYHSSEDISIFDWLSMFRTAGDKDKAILAALVYWNIWKTCNRAAFNNQRPNVAQTASRSAKDAIEWRIAWTMAPTIMVIPSLNTHLVP
ncbi:hypothetical protein LINGRAHAP2_LOCUS5168, partial [Linum grandiflorum]